jgi:hypothetical protein
LTLEKLPDQAVAVELASSLRLGAVTHGFASSRTTALVLRTRTARLSCGSRAVCWLQPAIAPAAGGSIAAPAREIAGATGNP